MLEITVNDNIRTAPPGTTAAELVQQLGLDPAKIAVEINRVVVPRRQLAECTLVAGDRVEIVTLVGGG